MIPGYSMWGDFPFIYFDNLQTNVTGNDIEELLSQCGRPQAASIYQSVKDMIPSIAPPAVNLTCLYGTGIFFQIVK